MQTLVKTIAEIQYLEQEAQEDSKHEYHNGEILSMAGATEEHNLIVSNIVGELYICLKGRKCKIYPSDLLLKLAQCKKYVYPDVMLVCEEAQIERKTAQSADVLLNPDIVIEVLSESTAFYDQNEKKRCYQMLPSLAQYVMIDSRKIEVISYQRTPENDWILDLLNERSDRLQIGDCWVSLADMYAQVTWEENKDKEEEKDL
ncbi:MAG: Uma2 family endonuclease [Microscillaceae bacterium]|nr:Uma2 family endonuclease [Microscillaceae bacterium]